MRTIISKQSFHNVHLKINNTTITSQIQVINTLTIFLKTQTRMNIQILLVPLELWLSMHLNTMYKTPLQIKITHVSNKATADPSWRQITHVVSVYLYICRTYRFERSWVGSSKQFRNRCNFINLHITQRDIGMYHSHYYTFLTYHISVYSDP